MFLKTRCSKYIANLSRKYLRWSFLLVKSQTLSLQIMKYNYQFF